MTTTEIKALCENVLVFAPLDSSRAKRDRRMAEKYFAPRAAQALKLAIDALERIDTTDDHPNIAGLALNKIEEVFR